MCRRLECQGVNGTRAGYPSRLSQSRRAAGEQDGCQGLVLVRLQEQVVRPCGLSPPHLVEAGVPGVQLPGCQEGDLGVRGSRGMVALTGTAWDLPPAWCQRESQQKLVLCPHVAASWTQASEIPSKPTGDPSPGTVVRQVSSVSQAAPRSDLQTRCHRELGSRHTQLSHIFLGPFPSQKCTKKEILGKVAPAWRVWHLLKPPWAGILLSCLFTDESESPKPKIVPAWHMLLLLLSHVSRVRLCATP